MSWIIGLLVTIAVLLVVLIGVVLLVGMAIEDRLNRMHTALWDGLHMGNLGPYLAELVKEARNRR